MRARLLEVSVYIDGGSRGNPGPAAAAVVVSDREGRVLAEQARYLGEATNNVAEWAALEDAVELLVRMAREHGPVRAAVYADSELLVRQFNGDYRIKNPALQLMALRVREKLAQHPAVRLTLCHVPREENAAADRAVNRELNRVLDRRKKEGSAVPNVPEVPRGAFLQRDRATYAVVPRLAPAGILDAATLRRLADVAEKYRIPIVKITSAQRIALVGLKPEEVELVWEDLGMEPAPAVGPCVHYVKACPGTVACRYGQQDALGLGKRLDERLLGHGELASKFKIGISGCPFNCCESWLRDFGAFGKAHGWTVVVGGVGGARPRIGDIVAENVGDDEVINLVERTIEAYKELGKKGERLARTIDRVGIDVFKARLER
ncbi:MAG: reverse transcriptase-like protein [Desulfotomaculales bacterium]